MEVRNNQMRCLPQRLRDARIACGKTIKEIANEVGISAQALSMFELGRCNPSAQMFFKLKNMYKFPISFYNKPYERFINRDAIYFRSFSVATKKKRNIALKRAELISQEIVGFINGKIEIPPVDSLFKKIKDSISIENNRDPELWAKIIRREWNLKDLPISNLIRELERRGVIVIVLSMDESVDGFSYWENNRPFIFVSKNNTAVRLRMSVAHELCHLFFHEGEDAEFAHKEKENEANLFASAFLLPKTSFTQELYTTSPDNLLYLKSKWLVSIAAIIMRCYKLDLISEDKYIYLQKQISRKHWRKTEPYDNEIEAEKPVILKQAIELLVNKNVISKSNIINQIGLNAEFIEESCSLKKGFLDTEDNLVQIHSINSNR